MPSDLVWLTITVNVIVAVVTIANTWALAWFNKKQTEAHETPAQHEKLRPAERRINRRIMLPATLMLFVSLLGVVLSAHAPAPDVTSQVLRIGGFIGGAVLAVVFLLTGYFISLFRGHVALTERIVGVVETVAKNSKNQPNEP